MASCDRGHELIHFEAEFSALCPLCRMQEEIKKNSTDVVENLERQLEEAQDDAHMAERRADRLEDELRAYKAAHPEAK